MSVTIRELVNEFPKDMRRLFGEQLSRIIVYGSYARGECNYSDFFVASEADAKIQYETAKYTVQMVKAYLQKRDVLV